MSDLVHRLWTNNWLNFRNAADTVCFRPNSPKLYIAFEIADTVINTQGVAYSEAIKVLDYMYHSKVCHTLVCTFLDENYLKALVKATGLKYDWYNNNQHFYGAKPYYDILIDSRAGFRPAEWVYVYDMYKLAEKLIDDSSTINHKSVFNKDKI